MIPQNVLLPKHVHSGSKRKLKGYQGENSKNTTINNADDWAACYGLKKEMQKLCHTSCNNYVS